MRVDDKYDRWTDTLIANAAIHRTLHGQKQKMSAPMH